MSSTARSDLYFYICDLFEERCSNETLDEINAYLDAFEKEVKDACVAEAEAANKRLIARFEWLAKNGGLTMTQAAVIDGGLKGK